ncbi:hypothetical protein MKY85_17425 [Paenibacillus sp. FSL R5-0749]|uniref:hypothetical protein n=1 Tax=Paenibacillus sp. FSL R5-0749 TaxID=2921657 RepID=UPI00315AF856
MRKLFIRKVGILLVAFLISTGALFQTEVKAATDYTGGLLDNKVFKFLKPTNFSTNLSDYDTSTDYAKLITDNNEATSNTLAMNNPSKTTYNQAMVVYKFDTEVKVYSFILKADNRASITFFDSEGKYIPIVWDTAIDGMVHESETIEGVRYVALTNPNVNIGIKVSEFNVYGVPKQEPEPQPEPGSDPQEPSGTRAMLVITMTTGLEKEFDLSMLEVNNFIDWYEAKQTGSGKASYAIDKHDNNKGPFKSRKDYILFDRVLTFEVSEY